MRQPFASLTRTFVILVQTFLLILSFTSNAQSKTDNGPDHSFSLREKATILLAGKREYRFEEIWDNKDLHFVPLTSMKENLGFSSDNYWLAFDLENPTDREMLYYLETARPITDVVDLYLVNDKGEVDRYKNGDKTPFSEKSVQHRKTIFDIQLGPDQKLKAYLNIKSDGEVVMLPLQLYPKEQFFNLTYKEQVFYGFFYGILILACIIYLFFFFALKDSVFIYYGLYVLFIALMQFSLDGFFHQYFTPGGGWLSDRAVLLTAFTSLFFFGSYGDKFLNLKQQCVFLHYSGKILGYSVLVGIVLLMGFAPLLEICYPLANAIGILILLNMVASIVMLKVKKVQVDPYFVLGISFLIFGFVVFILNNFNTIENSFFTNNGTKFGIGLEIIFLSISMSNRIRNLRMENEKNQLLALQRSQDMNEIKSSFLSNISHELRTPLNLIMGMASSLQQQDGKNDLEEKCGLILNSSKDLLGYIEDILDFTVIEKGNQELKEVSFDLQATINKVMMVHSKKANAKNLDFDLIMPESLPTRIVGDKGKLVQILNHLLDNAIKFTHEGKVEVRLQAKQKGGDKVALDFVIKDTGIGISKEKMSTIYESFTKKSFMDKREFSGLGLGLYIVKSYVDLQNGTVEIKNNADQGITCHLSLNFEMDEAELVLNQNTSLDSKDFISEGCQVLLVEDNKMNQTVVKLLFKKWQNVGLTIANNGVEALEILKRQTFDIILMDLQMPEMDGFETTSIIRSGKANCFAHIPIIIITADNTSKTRKEIFTLGADDLMTKPINEALLVSKINKNMPLKTNVA